jgi:hypothetical protein
VSAATTAIQQHSYRRSQSTQRIWVSCSGEAVRSVRSGVEYSDGINHGLHGLHRLALKPRKGWNGSADVLVGLRNPAGGDAGAPRELTEVTEVRAGQGSSIRKRSERSSALIDANHRDTPGSVTSEIRVGRRPCQAIRSAHRRGFLLHG